MESLHHYIEGGMASTELVLSARGSSWMHMKAQTRSHFNFIYLHCFISSFLHSAFLLTFRQIAYYLMKTCAVRKLPRSFVPWGSCMAGETFTSKVEI